MGGVGRVLASPGGDEGTRPPELLAPPEIEALLRRAERLVATGRFPSPEGEMPPVPWPPF
ncbi:hypothetical protein BHE97_19330 [Aeromicrobium sp. PE09-221]|nr:hypothetical protein BHE97_19330 [Aeromicrobium sp. PE09-221]